MKKLYQQFTQKMTLIIAELLAIIAEILVIGLAQLIFGYGEVVFLVIIYLLARFHGLTRKGMLKLLTRE